MFDINIDGMTPQKLINPKALSRGDSRLLWPLAALAVHGSDESAGRIDPQAPSLGSRARRSLARSRRLRSSRRSSVALRPHLPDRDAGRSEHRSDRSLSTFARINDFGFIETPYRKVENGRVTDADRLSHRRSRRKLPRRAGQRADRRQRAFHATRRSPCRYRGDFLEVEPAKVHYMDVSPKQLVSVAAGLIPFLEHDDANRALMGSNMQRQAVPLLVTEVAARRHRPGRQGRSRFARGHRRRRSWQSGLGHRRPDHHHQGRQVAGRQEEAQARSPRTAFTFTSCASSCVRTPAPASTRSRS